MTQATGTVAEALRRAGIDVELREPAPLPVALPASEQAVVRALQLAAAEGWRVVPSGLGGKLDWCRPEVAQGGADLILSTRRLDEVVAYVPGDGTLTAQAGCRMDTLAQHVAQHGHRLTPDVPHPGRATLGGTLAAGISGPDRQRFGPARHHVLGMRVALADGTVARSGGRLVKNVTGFDLHRLFCGSRGTLCLVLEASLRLFPAPEAECAWRLECTSQDAGLAAAEALARLPLRPQVVTLSSGPQPDGWSLDVFAGGHPRQLEAEGRCLRQALGTERLNELTGDAAREHRERLRDRCPTDSGAATLVVRCLPSHLARALETLGEELVGPFELVAQPLVASVEVVVSGRGAPALGVEAAQRLAGRLRALGADLEARAVPHDVHAALAPREADHPWLDWMFRLRDAFDPEGRFSSPLFPGLATRP